MQGGVRRSLIFRFPATYREKRHVPPVLGERKALFYLGGRRLYLKAPVVPLGSGSKGRWFLKVSVLSSLDRFDRVRLTEFIEEADDA